MDAATATSTSRWDRVTFASAGLDLAWQRWREGDVGVPVLNGAVWRESAPTSEASTTDPAVAVAGSETWWQHRWISLLIMSDLGPAARAKDRAMQATARDIEAQRRAINLQESSAIMLDRAHQTDKSRNARERAEHAREMLWHALAELEALRKAS
jgi:hypothetical protein